MKITIALDAMGGDIGPKVTVPAALRILKEYPELHLILVGREEVLRSMLKTALAEQKLDFAHRLTVHHASETVGMDEPPSQALRYKKDSSMRVAINLVKTGEAQACVSAGNTGALMATARFVLKTLPGIDRPAIIACMPTRKNRFVRVLDLGANVDSNETNLQQFALMGSVLVSAVQNSARPRVALLNVGEEDIKGNDLVKKTARLLENDPALNFVGYIEANRLFDGNVDVIVCDGFVGNVLLKACEGAAKFIADTLKTEFKNTLWAKLAAIPALPVLKKVAKRLDPDRRNGATLIGLKGTVIKSHGGANETSFAYAIEEAMLQVKKNIPDLIQRKIAALLEGKSE